VHCHKVGRSRSPIHIVVMVSQNLADVDRQIGARVDQSKAQWMLSTSDARAPPIAVTFMS
jgi:hypothetical protein